jgi:hypothetical protein
MKGACVASASKWVSPTPFRWHVPPDERWLSSGGAFFFPPLFSLFLLEKCFEIVKNQRSLVICSLYQIKSLFFIAIYLVLNPLLNLFSSLGI